MKLADLSQETIDRIKPVLWDRIIEKHEASGGLGVGVAVV
jgi:hypothetical protein